MFKWAFYAALYIGIGTVFANDIGPGTWHVNYIKKCDMPQHMFQFDISLKKINRTHDGFNARLTLDDDLDDGYGIRIDVCKECDGGCKLYQILSDNSIVTFINKYAKKNIEACFAMAGIEPPELPLKKGEYIIEDYVFDYSELPTDGPYGTFIAQAFVLRGTEELGCLELHVEFEELEDED